MPPAEPPVPAVAKQPAVPTVAYKQVKESAVYRLSELMFGSLLASYVLGFIGVAIADLTRPAGDFGMSLRGMGLPGGPVLIVLECAAISVGYAYLTASSYLSYHAGILTMFHMPLERLRWDFALALTQAVSFGLALICPESFPFMVGLVLAASIRRQRREYRSLVAALWLRKTGDDRRTPDEKFSSAVRRLLKEQNELSGWREPSGTLIAGSAFFLIAGSVILAICDGRRLPFGLGLHLNFWFHPIVVPIAVLATTVILMYHGHHHILAKRAMFLAETAKDGGKQEIDKQFEEFWSDLVRVK